MKYYATDRTAAQTWEQAGDSHHDCALLLVITATAEITASQNAQPTYPPRCGPAHEMHAVAVSAEHAITSLSCAKSPTISRATTVNVDTLQCYASCQSAGARTANSGATELRATTGPANFSDSDYGHGSFSTLFGAVKPWNGTSLNDDFESVFRRCMKLSRPVS